MHPPPSRARVRTPAARWLRSRLLLAATLALLPPSGLPTSRGRDWPVYGGDPEGTRHSPLRQIHRRNVHRLQPAWVYRDESTRLRPGSTVECNPLVVGQTLYLTTAGLEVVALDAATGTLRWRFDPAKAGSSGGAGVSRGLTWWESAEDGEQRLFSAHGSHLVALDPATGHPIPEFGEQGRLDLRVGLDRDLLRQAVGLTTPAVVYKDLLLVGSRVDDSPAARAPGHLRAFDARTGERRWIFHTIPLPGEDGYDTWPTEAWRTAAGCNAWGGLTLDPKRGIVFAGTGSPAYDHFGGDRPGLNLFGNCVLALDASTGRRLWHFQVVHHDLWDYDLPCPPVLVTVRRGGRRIPAAAQVTKTGHLFLFHRVTGEPLFPIEERRVPPSQLPGEIAWPTQPFPTRPPAFARQGMTAEDVTDLNPEAHAAGRALLERIQPAPLFQPPSLTPSVVLPQFNGGAEWGGAAFDPASGLLFVNASNEAEWISMVPSRPTDTVSLHALGEHLFGALCTTCHGTQGKLPGLALASTPTAPGAPLVPPPSLSDLARRLSRPDAERLLETGRGQMPSFATLGPLERRALLAFVYGDGQDETIRADASTLAWADRFPFLATGHHPLLDPEGFPVNRRPWGTLSAIDLRRGTLAWQVPLGTYPELERRGYPPTGTFNIGGPITTAGGLVFIGATRDERFRAFDQRTGRVLWEFQLDAGGYATPATYSVGGRQFVVIAAGGGGKAETRSGNAYWAFSLPR